MQDDPQSLLRAAQTGDERAFTQLYQLYYAPLFRYILVRIGDEAAAEDLTQTTFIKLHRQLTGVQRDIHLGYFYAAARNAVVDYYRKSGQRPVEASEEILAQLPDAREGVESEIIQKQAYEIVATALRQLPEEQQSVLVLRYIEGKSGRETAALIGKTEVATRQIQVRALQNLRKLIADKDL